MRATLADLQAMSDERLSWHWEGGKFPAHKKLEAQVMAVGDLGGRADNMPFVREHLEELYALRLFYDSLYPPVPAAEPAVAEAVAVQP